jgi:hypothetical protein
MMPESQWILHLGAGGYCFVLDWFRYPLTNRMNEPASISYICMIEIFGEMSERKYEIFDLLIYC